MKKFIVLAGLLSVAALAGAPKLSSTKTEAPKKGATTAELGSGSTGTSSVLSVGNLGTSSVSTKSSSAKKTQAPQK